MSDERKAKNKATENERWWSTDVFVYFTSYENRLACGMVELPYLKKTMAFQGLDQLLLMLEDMMDFVNSKNKDAHYPQASFAKKALLLQKRTKANPDFHDFSGNEPIARVTNPFPGWNGTQIAFAVISVRYRQHASMQGMLRTKERDMPFRSGLELTRLLHQLLESKTGQPKAGNNQNVAGGKPVVEQKM